MRILSDWYVIVPIKQGGDGKSRLGAVLGNDARSDLAERMAAHVLGILQECFGVSCIIVLSPERPPDWTGEWVRDEGRGLNEELTAWRVSQGKAPILIIHADLPLVSVDDVRALIDGADRGIALATDRTGQGTNALAIADGRPLMLRFGSNSRALHCAQYPGMRVIEREGLMADLDTPEDADFVAARGFHI